MQEKEMLSVQRIRDGFQYRLSRKRGVPGKENQEFFYQTMVNYLDDILNARAKGGPVAASMIYAPIEVYLAMGIIPFMLENFSLISSSQGQAPQWFEAAEGWGYPSEACRVQALLVGLAKAGVMPRPDLLVGISVLCDNVETCFSALADIYRCPYFLIDGGYSTKSKSTVEYYKQQLKQFIELLEEVTGRRLDYGRLQEILNLSKKACDYWYRICELKKVVPAPMSCRESLRDYTLILIGAGRHDVAEYFERRYQEIQERVKTGDGVVPSKEKHRILWCAAYPFFDLALIDWLATEQEAVIVGDFFDPVMFNNLEGNWTPDTSDPLEFLARKALNFPGSRCCGPFNSFKEDAISFCQEAQVDVVVYFANMGCKNCGGLTQLWKDVMKERLGIPTVILDGDIFDPTVASGRQMREQLSEFFSIL